MFERFSQSLNNLEAIFKLFQPQKSSLFRAFYFQASFGGDGTEQVGSAEHRDNAVLCFIRMASFI